MSATSTSRVAPATYQVDRHGGLPRDGFFFVLDLAHDFEARVAIAKLANNYERQNQHQLAEECRKALIDSQDAFAAMCEAKNARMKQEKNKKKDNRA